MSKIQVNKLHTLTGHNQSIFALAEGVSPNYFYSGDGQGMVVEWDLEKPKNGKLLAKLSNSVYALFVDKESQLLFIGENFEGLHVVDLKQKKEDWSLKITSSAIFDIKCRADQLFVATGDGVLVVLDIHEKSPLKHIKVANDSLRVIALSPNRDIMAIGCSDNTIKVFELPSFEPIANLKGHTNSVFALDFSPDGRHLISGGRDAHLRVWNTGDFSLAKDIAAHMYAINFLDFREDGKYFVTCSMDKSIKLWDAQTFKLLKVIDKARHAGHGTSINKIIWSSYQGQIVAVSDDRTLSIWDIEFSSI
ncbi:WD40 repeat domain-containing protein [Pleomorphovibrio marinus]|uniref:WD40 repeat domain-containing protein n=1 Tax=Pleomorphovibrio marinus TaxID=2164132 RepID=UPI000E0C1F18|nr:WD40 repeat domain-containing protein [Pleomorphovibrio marinus]